MLYGELSSCGSGHSGCCSPGLCKSAGIPGVAVLVCANQRAFRVLQSWSVQISGHSGCCSPGLCKSADIPRGQDWSSASADIPGVAVGLCLSQISGHSGCCSPGLCEQSAGQDGLGFSLPSCESGHVCGNQRAFRVLPSWSVRAKEEPGRTRLCLPSCLGSCVSEISGHSGCCSPGLGEQKARTDGHSGCCSPGLCKSAGIPGVAVLVCANQKRAIPD